MQDDLESALARVREAAKGGPGLLLIRGPGQSGKSALVAELSRLLADEVEVLATRCAADGGDYSVAAGLLGSEVYVILAEVADDHERLQRLRQLAGRRAAGRPLMLVLDDAHLCDAATARWLTFLARRSAGLPLVGLITVPCQYQLHADSMFTELTGVLGSATLGLGPLGQTDVQALVEHECGMVPDGEFVRVCVEECRGIPGILLHWLAGLAREGGVPDAAGAEWLRREALADTVAWLTGQSGPLAAYITAVAVLGSTVPVAVGTLAGMSVGELAEAQALLTRTGVLAGDGRFRLAALRQAVLAAVEPEELTKSAERSARLLSEEGRPHSEVAEVLMMLPALTEPWMYCALREAAKDAAVCREDAARYLRRVLAAVPGHVDTRLELAAVLSDELDPVAALELYAGVLPDVTDADVRATVIARYGAAALRSCRVREAFPVLVAAARELPAMVNLNLRAEVDATIIEVGMHDVATVRAALEYSRGIKLPCDAMTDARSRLAHQLARADVFAGGSVERALELLRSAMPSPGATNDSWDVYAASTLYHCGAQDDGLAVAEWVLDVAASNGDPRKQSLALVVRAALRLREGYLADAEADAEKAITTIAGGTHGDGSARVVLAVVAVRRGEHDRASALLTELGAPIQPIDLGWVEMARARLLEHKGQYTQAVEVLLSCGGQMEAAGVHNPYMVPWRIAATRLLVRLGRMAEAADVAAGVAATCWNTPATRGIALFTRGLVADDAEAIEASIAEFAAARDRMHEIEALTALGSMLLRKGQDKAARKHLRAAVDLAVRCGELVAAEVARVELTSAGGRMGELAARPRDVLTSGELKVAQLAARGLTNREIATTLFVTVRTVESHLANAYRKLGVRTRDCLADRLS